MAGLSVIHINELIPQMSKGLSVLRLEAELHSEHSRSYSRDDSSPGYHTPDLTPGMTPALDIAHSILLQG